MVDESPRANGDEGWLAAAEDATELSVEPVRCGRRGRASGGGALPYSARPVRTEA